jgi:ubiquinone/menaquinone biosynthesis C-methylase UbiE
MSDEMRHWKKWEQKNAKYNEWYVKKPAKVFPVLWDILQKKCMELVPSATFKNEILLDVGCGDGRYLLSSIRNKGYFTIGIDPNKEVSLKQAKKRVTEAGFRDAFLVRGVGEFIPLPRSSVSVVLFNSALDHVMEPEIVLKEIHKTLKDDGLLVMWQGIHNQEHSENETSEQETHLRVFRKDDLAKILIGAGFFIESFSLVGCDIIHSSEKNKSATSRLPQFLNNNLLIFLQAYLAMGKILPKHASIMMLRSKKNKDSLAQTTLCRHTKK